MSVNVFMYICGLCVCVYACVCMCVHMCVIVLNCALLYCSLPYFLEPGFPTEPEAHYLVVIIFVVSLLPHHDGLPESSRCHHVAA